MPYEIKAGEGETYDVINTATGQVKATHQPPDAKEKAERQVKLLHEVDVVHKIVNQQHTDMANYQRALIAALNGAGVAVPDDQSINNT